MPLTSPLLYSFLDSFLTRRMHARFLGKQIPRRVVPRRPLPRRRRRRRGRRNGLLLLFLFRPRPIDDDDARRRWTAFSRSIFIQNLPWLTKAAGQDTLVRFCTAFMDSVVLEPLNS